VIPTGSMAETLYGYQKDVTCPQCGFYFPVNCSSETDDDKNKRTAVIGCTCPNCRYGIDFKNDGLNPSCNTGDRVLVAKMYYDSGIFAYKPFDVPVFKFPEEPQHDHTPMNYIKRLIGLPGQTIGIYYGDIFVADEWKYPEDKDAPDAPIRRQLHRNEKNSLLEEGSKAFKILRKTPDKIIPMSRIVYDNEHQAKDLVAKKYPPRWAPEVSDENNGESGYLQNRERANTKQTRWGTTQAMGFSHTPAHPILEDKGPAWLRYRHLLRGQHGLPVPELVTDFMGYNSGVPERNAPPNWVGDLMLECDVNVEKAEGLLILELSKGVDRFQAQLKLDTGMCELVRLNSTNVNKPEVLDSKPTKLKKPGTYRLRFANYDERLTLWVDRDLPFDNGVAYDPPFENGRPLRGPSEKNDLEPASIGASGAALSVHHLKLWRDTYYTNPSLGTLPAETWSDPKQWDELRKLPAITLYVQPGHYLCLGDNSPQSSDSRSWGRQDNHDGRGGLVPERLMLGRALSVYWPYNRVGLIR
jgi:signal peptidase I